MTCSGTALRRCSPERPWTRRSRLLTAPPISMGCWIKCTLEFWATVLGTDLHIAPTIGDLAVADGGKVEREVNTLQPGLVIALEPGIYLDGIGGGCCENMTLITENGPEVLTKTRFDERLLLR